MAGRAFLASILTGALALSACDLLAPVQPVPSPPNRPDALVPPPAKPDTGKQKTTGPSAKSQALASFYERLEARRIAQGLLRTDGGGIDTRYTTEQITENFERIAFYNEYALGQGRAAAGKDVAGSLKRWETPIRAAIEFGDGVARDSRAADRAEVTRYLERMSRLTGHPVSVSDNAPNFHILYMSEDDAPALRARLQELSPGISNNTLAIFENMPRRLYCAVLTFSEGAQRNEIKAAIVVIRAENPGLLRKACVHEEIAQGFGLLNDYPRARPSIFDDDEEFALLTSHDEILLKTLYDRRLRTGMSLDTARPIFEKIIEQHMGEGAS